VRKRVLCLILALACVLSYLPMSALAATALPNGIYLKQETGNSCTLASATMMIRARMYLSGNMDWDEVAESMVRQVAWGGGGLQWNWTYTYNGSSVRVGRRSFESDGVDGTTISELKSILDAHPEGIVFFCGNRNTHAVFLTDYEGDTFYCADPAGGYSGKRIKLSASLLGARFGSQASILQEVSSYWYVASYNIEPTGYIGYCKEYPAYSTIKLDSQVSAMSLPCDADTDDESEVVTKLSSGTQLTAVAVVENKEGEYWYQITTDGGDVAYIPAKSATYLSYEYSDVTISDVTAPTEHVIGNSFSIRGYISGKNNMISEVSGYIYRGSNIEATPVTGGVGTVNRKSYSLQNSAVDNKLLFGSLGEGEYTYVVRATYINYYVDEDGDLASNTGTLVMHQSSFVVVDPQGTVVVTFHPNGGKVDVQTAAVKVDTAIGDLPIATMEGFNFDGWYTEPVDGSKITSSTIIIDNITVFAHWSCDHIYTDALLSESTCTVKGQRKYTCISCGNSYVEDIDLAQHDYEVQIIPATCTEYEQIQYSCNVCNHTYQVSVKDTYSEWSATIPEGVDESALDTKTVYRFSDYETVTTYEPTLAGYTLMDKEWEAIETADLPLVKQWPSGFLKTSPLYAVYSSYPEIPTFETETDKTTVTSNEIIGYLYYHWCANEVFDGPHNRAGKANQTASCDTFHAFESTVNPNTLYGISDGSYRFKNGDCCKDTWWYYVVPIYKQTYTSWRNQFHYSRWTEWSNWNDIEYVESDTRKVESQQWYRYMNTSLGEHPWDDGEIITHPSCQEEGKIRYTCKDCNTTKEESIPMTDHDYQNGVCQTCGMEKENEKFSISFANMSLNNSLDINFAFEQGHRDDWTGYYAQIAKKYADGRPTEIKNIPMEQWGTAMIGGKPYYTLKFDGIAAKEMSDMVYVTIYNAERKPVSTCWEDSVRSYAMRTLANPNSSQETMTMVVDLLNYGAAAQKAFGYNTSDLANNKLTAQQAAMATQSAEASDSRVSGENYLGTQLRLESQIMLRMAFNNVDQNMYAIISFTNHSGRECEIFVDGSEFEMTGEVAAITIDDIVVADGRMPVTVTVYGPDDQVVASATDSMESYIARMSESDELFLQILKFSDSAYRYFH